MKALIIPHLRLYAFLIFCSCNKEASPYLPPVVTQPVANNSANTVIIFDSLTWTEGYDPSDFFVASITSPARPDLFSTNRNIEVIVVPDSASTLVPVANAYNYTGATGYWYYIDNRNYYLRVSSIYANLLGRRAIILVKFK